ncbi:MAG: hypothetical protein ACREBJ_09055 [Nitrosotalea sp.]
MKIKNFAISTVILLTVIVISPYLLHPAVAQVSQTVVNHLESDITDAKNSANTAVQSYARVAQSFQQVKDSIDTLYMVSLAGIGIGVAGVVIAVTALTRKTS